MEGTEIVTLHSFHIEGELEVEERPQEGEQLDARQELELQEEIRGRKLRCTCQEDPVWCELHNVW